MKPLSFRRYLGRFLPHLAVESYRPMVAVYSMALAQPLSDADRTALAILAGERAAPSEPVSELDIIAGRASGKTEMAAAFLGYLALAHPWKVKPGQEALGALICTTTERAALAKRFFLGQFESNPTLRNEIANVTAKRVEFRKRTAIEIAAADSATLRGPSMFAALVDECAWLPTALTSASPDVEIVAALRPALARLPGSMLVLISSPYSMTGVLYENWRRSFGVNDPHTLVVRGGTNAFNPTFPQTEIDRALAEDPERFSAEYLAEWRSDIAGFVDGPLVDGATRSSPRDLPPRLGVQYRAAIDPSGGRSDAAGLAIGHREDSGRIIIDSVKRFPAPHDPGEVAKAIAAHLRDYRIAATTSDAYAAGFAKSAYKSAGVTLTDAPGDRSAAYLHLLPLLTRSLIELPPDPVLRTELLTLQRRTRSGGRDVIDHRAGSHDDLSNATALCAWMCALSVVASNQVAVFHSGIARDARASGASLTEGQRPVQVADFLAGSLSKMPGY